MTAGTITNWKEQNASLFGKHTVNVMHSLEDSGSSSTDTIADPINRCPESHHNISPMGDDHRRKLLGGGCY